MGEGPFVSPLLGRFNLMNLLQAVGVLVQCQLPLMPLLEAIEGFRGVPGRMERVLLPGVDAHSLPTVLVDYAHTPDGQCPGGSPPVQPRSVDLRVRLRR